MGESLTFQKLLRLQRQVWTFTFRNRQIASESMLREQLRSIEQISRLGMIIAAPLMCYLIFRLVSEASPGFILIGLGYVALASYFLITNLRRESEVDGSGEDVRRAIRRIKIESIINAFGYSGMIAVPIAFGQFAPTMDMAMLALGTIIVGGFVFGSVPKAQTFFIAITTAGQAAGFLIGGGSSVLAGTILLCFFAACTDYIYRIFFFNFAQRHIHAEKLKENAETVRLLLNDYAEQSSDWLWEVDEDFQIVRASQRFADAANQKSASLNGTALVELFTDCTERNALANSLTSGTDFRDLILPLSVNSEDRWWKLSGRLVSRAGEDRQTFRGVATDVTATKKAEDRVAHLAHFDSLTDLPNRALFNESLQRSIHRMRDRQMLAVMYLDLDNFKLINDTLGHGAGNAVLKSVANRLENAIGIEDVVCRLGGDEFAISLRSIDSQQAAEEAARKIIDAIGEPVMVEGQPVSTGISIGMALSPDHGDTAETLIKHADIALYRAKKKDGAACPFSLLACVKRSRIAATSNWT